MNAPNSKPVHAILRCFSLVCLTIVAWSGSMLSKLGPVGQDMREWALMRMERLG